MPNPITGDFAAVVQLNGSVINRLLASMHQNAFADASVPSFPHKIDMRIGDDRPASPRRVRGRVRAQLGCPRISFASGATDRFRLEVEIRAQYIADPASLALAEFIHGTVRADYRMEDVPPDCFGWRGIAHEYVWIRVVEDSVVFIGTAVDDLDPMVLIPASVDENELRARITNEIAYQLSRSFEATPHKVEPRFRRGGFRGIVSGGHSAIVIPLAVGGDPTGNLNTVDNVFLNDSAFGAGVSADVIMSFAQPALHQLRSAQISFPVQTPVADTVYRVSLTDPVATWVPHGSYGAINIKFSGSAETRSVLPNIFFSADLNININFDGSAERLWLSPGSRSIPWHTSRNVFSGHVPADRVNRELGKAVSDKLQAACDQAQPTLDALIARKNELLKQLRTFDPQANGWFDSAEFTAAGMVLRGPVSLSPRRAPSVEFGKATDKQSYTALEAWVPGGRVDQFQWAWRWDSASQAPGSANHNDRFVLRRPPAKLSRWGGLMSRVSQPVPGLGMDGTGRVCLRLRGAQVDEGGGLSPVASREVCHKSHLWLGIGPSVAGGRLLHAVREGRAGSGLRETALVDVGASRSGSNTMVLSLGERGWDRRLMDLLGEAMSASRREDAGLAVLVLFPDGGMERAGEGVVAEIEEMGLRLGASVVVNDDVRRAWSHRMALPPDRPAWRLLSPDGCISWMSDGETATRVLAAGLDDCLFTSEAPSLHTPYIGVQVATRFSPAALVPELILPDPPRRRCPPSPVGRVKANEQIIAFAVAGSASSEGKLRQLAATQDLPAEQRPHVLVVADGPDANGAEQLRRQFGGRLEILPDVGGSIAARLGISTWPTTLTLDQNGIVAQVETGYMRNSDGDCCKETADV